MDRFFYLILLVLVFDLSFAQGNKTLGKTYMKYSPDKPCVPGQVYKLSCNVCKCNEKRNLLCTKIACADELKLLYSKGLFPNKSKTHLRTQKNRIAAPLKSKEFICQPGKIYKKKNHLCYCNYEKKLVCSKNIMSQKLQIRGPADVYPPLTDQEFVDLPTLFHSASKCEPGLVYRVQCDTCLCLHHGNTLCTDHLCLPQEGINRRQAERVSGQPCKVKKDLKNECIKCDCVNDSLKCNVVPNCKPVLRNLHGDFKQNDTFFDLDTGSCTPYETLTKDCNVCHCQKNQSLRCTQKICLNHKEAQSLKEELEALKKMKNNS